MTFHHVWLATVAHDAAPRAGAALVRPLVCDRAFFDVRDRVKLVRALARHPDFEEVGDDGPWVWMENPLLHDRTLGQLGLEAHDRLTLETWVYGAQDHGRKLLGHLAGAALRFRGVEHLGVQPSLRDGAPLPPEWTVSVRRTCRDLPCHTGVRDSRERPA
jgi:hypothetical protein